MMDLSNEKEDLSNAMNGRSIINQKLHASCFTVTSGVHQNVDSIISLRVDLKRFLVFMNYKNELLLPLKSATNLGTLGDQPLSALIKVILHSDVKRRLTVNIRGVRNINQYS